jgi:hypothetical protein
MVDHILSQFVVDDFDGETAILYGPQGPFEMMQGPCPFNEPVDHIHSLHVMSRSVDACV